MRSEGVTTGCDLGRVTLSLSCPPYFFNCRPNALNAAIISLAGR